MSVPVYHWLSLLSTSGVVTTTGTSLDSVGMCINYTDYEEELL